MRFSEAFALDKIQAQLDFVDIELDRDLPLYVDPFAFSIRKDEWSSRCTRHIVSFFQSVIDAIHTGNYDKAKNILTNLSEPNETRLGKSVEKPQGRGVRPPLGGQQNRDRVSDPSGRFERPHI
jgi:hypothetical protein